MELARADDPITSKLAAAAIQDTAHYEAQVMVAGDAAMRFPGRTSRELAVLEPMLDRYVYARRLPEAVNRGWIEEGPPRRCLISQQLAKTWGPVNFFNTAVSQ